MDHDCHFSPDRKHHSSLVHRWNPLFGDRLILRVAGEQPLVRWTPGPTA